MKTKLKLTRAEADYLCWQEAEYLGNVRHDRQRAARYAWRQAVQQFPRLANFNRPTP